MVRFTNFSTIRCAPELICPPEIRERGQCNCSKYHTFEDAPAPKRQNTCPGFCGMSYCDENGCLEGKEMNELILRGELAPKAKDTLHPFFLHTQKPDAMEVFLFLLALSLTAAGLIILLTTIFSL